MSIEEIWKPVEEFKDTYEVSNLGRVRSKERFLNTRTYPSQIMKPFIGNNTNIFVHLRDGKKQVRRSVPKLVLLAFVGPPPPPSRQVRHIDGDQNNNALSNLKWDIRKAYFLPENAEARKLFNEKAVHYVRAIAYRFFSHKLFGIPAFDLEDLMQISLLNIWNDIDTYNPDVCAFYTFCKIRVGDSYKRNMPKALSEKKRTVLFSQLDENYDRPIDVRWRKFGICDTYSVEEDEEDAKSVKESPCERKYYKNPLRGREDMIKALRQRGISKSEIARIFGVCPQTVSAFIKKNKLEEMEERE